MLPKKKAKTDEKLVQNFVWTDDEVSLLLSVVEEHKASQIHAGFDWESFKTKYVDSTEMFVKRYPTTATGTVDRHSYPKFDPGNQFTKERVLSKIKAIRVKYKAALDSGRRSGGGRVVATFFDMCSNIWAGSPSAQCIDGGLESSNVGSVEKDTEEEAESATVQSDHEKNDCIPGPGPDPDADNGVEKSSNQIALCENSVSQTSGRRDLIAFIQDQRNGNLKKKLPSDKVMIDLTKEDLQLKREIVKQLKEKDADQKEQLKVMTETVGNLAKSISEGFSALTSYLNQPHRYPLRPLHPDSLGTAASDSQRLTFDQSYHLE